MYGMRVPDHDIAGLHRAHSLHLQLTDIESPLSLLNGEAVASWHDHERSLVLPDVRQRDVGNQCPRITWVLRCLRLQRLCAVPYAGPVTAHRERGSSGDRHGSSVARSTKQRVYLV
jgi:hypothetical protein